VRADIRIKHLSSFAFGRLPRAARELAQTAFHQIVWNDDWDEGHFFLLEDMVQTCIELMRSEFTGRTWLLALQEKLGRSNELRKVWPVRAFEYDGHIYTRGLEGRLFAAIALWRIELALEAILQRRPAVATEEIANAGMALHFAGVNDAYADSEVNQSHQRKKGSAARWESDPTQQARLEIRAEWERWQLGAARYKNEEDFGRKMQSQYGAYKSERSISNLARRWRTRDSASC
jgi:hypothetical protein